MPEYKFPTFVKACTAYFNDRKVTIPEFKELTVQDKRELSEMLNELPEYTHPTYEPVAA